MINVLFFCAPQFLIGLLLTILIDIVHFAVFYPLSSGGDLFRFSMGMAILSLILKPFSCFFVYQMYRERGGEYNINFGKWADARNAPLVRLSFSDSAALKCLCKRYD